VAPYGKLKTSKEINEAGKNSLERALKNQLLEPGEILKLATIQKILPQYHFAALDDLYRQITHGDFSANNIAEKIKKYFDQERGVQTEEVKEIAPDEKTKQKLRHTEGVYVVGVDDVLVHIARCCTPLPGDEIAGIVTKGHGVSVHRTTCPNVSKREGSHQVKVEWNPSQQIFYDVALEVKAFDRVGLLKDILNEIAETKTNIKEAQVKTKNFGGVMMANLTLAIKDAEHLAGVMNTIRNVNDVYDVYRAKF